MTQAITRRSKTSLARRWFTYILECADGTYYAGITTDLARRLKMHNDGIASRFTRARTPVRLRYAEEHTSQSEATVRELEIKTWRRARKAALFRSTANLLHHRRRRPAPG